MAGCAGAHDTVGVGAGQDAVTVEEGVTEGGVSWDRTTRGRANNGRYDLCGRWEGVRDWVGADGDHGRVHERGVPIHVAGVATGAVVAVVSAVLGWIGTRRSKDQDALVATLSEVREWGNDLRETEAECREQMKALRAELEELARELAATRAGSDAFLAALGQS